MTNEEKIDAINKLSRESRDILDVTSNFNKNNPYDTYTLVLRKIDSDSISFYGVKIKDEILMTVIEMLERKLRDNYKKIDELLGVEE